VIVVDESSNLRAEVPKGELDAYEPDVEAVIDEEPDLGVPSDDADDLLILLADATCCEIGRDRGAGPKGLDH